MSIPHHHNHTIKMSLQHQYTPDFDAREQPYLDLNQSRDVDRSHYRGSRAQTHSSPHHGQAPPLTQQDVSVPAWQMDQPIDQQNSRRFSLADEGPRRRGPQDLHPPSPPQLGPPSYPGPPMDGSFDASDGGSVSAGTPRRRPARHARRGLGGTDVGINSPADQGAVAPSSSSAPASPCRQQRPSSREVPTSQEAFDTQKLQQQQRERPSNSQSPTLGDPTTPGRVDRLSSPSIVASVLKPIENKMREYQALMLEAADEMAQLDEELRALQERKRLAEERFMAAKSKHDEYERQRIDVDRALRGEGTPQQQQSPRAAQTLQGQQQWARSTSPSWTMERMPSVESFDDRPASGQSSGTGKAKRKSRLGISLFR